MELHPDRNYGDVEEATKQFADVQSAYEILSDPQERAWYDTHRDAILRSGNDLSDGLYDHDVRVTTAEDVLRMMTRFHGKIDFSDASTGFFGALRSIFETLANEEALACQWEGHESLDYPSFGHADDNYDDVIKPFYAAWSSFATKKSFSWADIYRYSEAPDRRVRRLMEKENKRLRDEGIREFNDAVRSLVAFVKKRDPRYKPNVQTEVERQTILQNAANAQAARSRAANQAKNAQAQVIPDWMNPIEAEGTSESDEVADDVQERFECVICKKDFKSENQYEAHEKSKKHVKAVQSLRRQMQKEDQTLDLREKDQEDGAISSMPTLKDQRCDESMGRDSSEVRKDQDYTPEDRPPNRLTQTQRSATHGREAEGDEQGILEQSSEMSSLSSDDEYTTRENVEHRLRGLSVEDPDSKASSRLSETSQNVLDDRPDKLAADMLTHEAPDSKPKLGKAKEKRARKAAQKKASSGTESGKEFKCITCQATFRSKTRLFNHLKDYGHAQPVPRSGKHINGQK